VNNDRIALTYNASPAWCDSWPLIALIICCGAFIPAVQSHQICRAQEGRAEGEAAAAVVNENPIENATTEFATRDAVELVNAQQPPRNVRYWTTNWSFQDINIGTLARRLSRIGIAAPVDLDGTVSVEFAVSIPINALRDATAYRIVGTIQSTRLRVESTTLSLNTDVNYQAGIASLNNLQGQLFSDSSANAVADAGAFAGKASLRLAGQGERLANVSLAIDRVRLSVLTGAFSEESGLRINATGNASGDLQWVAPVDSITDPTTWNADGRLAIRRLSIDNRPPLDLDTGPFRIGEGSLDVPSLRMNVVGTEAAGLTAALNTEFNAPQRWTATINAQRLPIESVAAVVAMGAVPATYGNLTLDVTASGTLTPLDWQVEGQLQSQDLSVYGVPIGEFNHTLLTDNQRFSLSPHEALSSDEIFRTIEASYEITPESINLTQIDAEMFGGQIAGDVRWARDLTLSHHANLDWTELALRWDVGSVTSGMPAELLLNTQGRVAWDVPAQSLELPAAHTFRAVLNFDNLLLGGQSIGNASVQVRAVDGSLAVRGTGALLGGSFEVDSTSEIPTDLNWSQWLNGPDPLSLSHQESGWSDERINAANDQWEENARIAIAQRVDFIEPSDFSPDTMDTVLISTLDPPRPASVATGRLRLRGLSLQRAGDLLRQLTSNVSTGRAWGGRGDANIDFNLGSSSSGGLLATRATIGIFNFTVHRNLVTRALGLELRTRGGQLNIDSLRGSYAGGAVEATGSWTLPTGPRQLLVTFSRVDSARAFLPLSSDAMTWFAGQLSGRVRIHEANGLRLAGSLEGSRAIVFGIPLGAVRSGLNGLVASGGGWEVSFPNVRSTVAQGRISGYANLSSSQTGSSFDLRSQWNARNVNFERLIMGLGSSSNVGRGNLSASLSLDGRNIRNSSDLVGQFEGTLAGTSASAVPGLSSARRFLGPVAGGTLTFTEGGVRGQIRNNLVLINQLALRSDQLRVVADGSIRLDNSRLNIRAVAATGDFSAQSLVARAAARQLALVVSPPLALLLNLNQLLNDRTVYMQIGGTPAAPVVRVRPLQTLGHNALRYFLQELTLGGSAIALGVAGD